MDGEHWVGLAVQGAGEQDPGANGFITSEVIVASMFGIAGCMAGNLLGRMVFDKLDGAKLKKIIYAGMIISGILMII